MARFEEELIFELDNNNNYNANIVSDMRHREC